MVAKIFCILLFTVLCKSKKSLVPQAIVQLVRSNYDEHPVVIEVFYNSREVKILDETLKLLRNEKQFKVTPINKNVVTFDESYDVNCTSDNNGGCITAFLKNAIFLFDTIANYQKFMWNLFLYFEVEVEFQHLVYCEDASELNIQKILTRGKESVFKLAPINSYESFLLVKDGQISLQTMTLFTEKQCGVEQLVEINQFSSWERKWKTEKFFLPRIENFHACELRIGFYSTGGDGLPFIRMLEKEDGTETAEGSFVDMFEALSTHLNFTALTPTQGLVAIILLTIS